MRFGKSYLGAVMAALIISPAPRADTAPGPAISWTGPITQQTTQQVKTACESKEAADLAYCYANITALYDASQYYGDVLEAGRLCIPDKTSADDMRKALLEITKARPDQLIGPISIFFYMAMNAKYPCGPDGMPLKSKTAPAPTNKSTK